MTTFPHIPVMKEECIDGLSLKDDGIYFDGTLGFGGHSYEILKRNPTTRLIATDLDDEAIAASKERLKEFSGRFSVYKSNYKDFERVFEEEGVDKIDGAIIDCGISSKQIDDYDRGFSIRGGDAKLDMRMDQTAPLTAIDVVNGYSPERLLKIIKEYGEEKFASNIVRNIVKRRESKKIETCGELKEIIDESIPAKFKIGAPCERKTFQAIRIEVNGELNGLYDFMIKLTKRLKKGGRIVVLTFHSLEDRIVKDAFRELETDCVCPKTLPVCVCGKRREIKIITKKPITATEAELSENSRSKCAKLRIAERI